MENEVAVRRFVGRRLLPRLKRPAPDGTRYKLSKEWIQVRGHKLFPQLEQQKRCLCWLYVVTEIIEAWFYQRFKKRIKVSKQELLDKCKPEAEIGYPYPYCVYKALLWVQDNGLSFEKDYTSFSAVKKEPEAKRFNQLVVRISGVMYINGNAENKILEALNIRPLGAKLILCKPFYYRLRSSYRKPEEFKMKQIYALDKKEYDSSKKEGNHAIVLSGWGSCGEDQLINYEIGSSSTRGISKTQVNFYHARDPNAKKAPNNGFYKVKRDSSVGRREYNPIDYVAFATEIFTDRVD